MVEAKVSERRVVEGKSSCGDVVAERYSLMLTEDRPAAC